MKSAPHRHDRHLRTRLAMAIMAGCALAACDDAEESNSGTLVAPSTVVTANPTENAIMAPEAPSAIVEAKATAADDDERAQAAEGGNAPSNLSINYMAED